MEAFKNMYKNDTPNTITTYSITDKLEGKAVVYMYEKMYNNEASNNLHT